MEFDADRCREASTVLRSLVGPVRAERGCLSTQLMEEAGAWCRLTWVAEWNRIEDFELHLRTEAFRRILAVIELSANPPVVEIDDVSSRRGFDLVAEILGYTPLEHPGQHTG
jgi:quinol monooxygenase YgiN